jgi:hypothetical protein
MKLSALSPAQAGSQFRGLATAIEAPCPALIVRKVHKAHCMA